MDKLKRQGLSYQKDRMRDYNIKKLSDYKWEVEADESLGMRVPGIIFADEIILEHARSENTIDQVINVATLPGILEASFAMPDIHFGYGFPIGGVAAFDMEDHPDRFHIGKDIMMADNLPNHVYSCDYC